MQLGVQNDGHVYWKMKIISIHKGKGGIWAIGYWFYSPSDLEDLGLHRRCVLGLVLVLLFAQTFLSQTLAGTRI